MSAAPLPMPICSTRAPHPLGRRLDRLIDAVAGAEGAGWDLTKPATLARGRQALWLILWAEAPDLAETIYGPQSLGENA